MRKLVATVILLVSLVGIVPGTAHAGGAASAALGLGAFAVFNQILGGVGIFGLPWAYAAPAYYPAYAYAAPVYAAPAPAYYTASPSYAPPRPVQRDVVYPHGRYVLSGDGVTVAYRWVWVPNPPPPPPPPAEKQ
jgi:hypothetical protein